MANRYAVRRSIAGFLIFAAVAVWIFVSPDSYETEVVPADGTDASSGYVTPLGEATNPESPLATAVLEKLEIKGRAPKTGYTRDQFYSSWPTIDGCSLRQRIIRREFGDTARLDTDNCTVLSGEIDEPYTGSHLIFYEKSEISKGIQIDHVVALSDAWQKGAQNITKDERYSLATDPLNLLAVDASTNQGKSDGDAASWLPSNKAFRCQYVARQISVKYKYHLWVSSAEHDIMAGVLAKCPNERAIGISL